MTEPEGKMTGCEEAVDRVYDYLDGELDADTMDEVREHLEMCRRCYPYFNFERIFLDHIRSRGCPGESNPELERRVRELLREVEGEDA